MNKTILALVFLAILTVQGCSSIPRERIKVVKTTCPKLKIWDVNKTVPSYEKKFKSPEEKEQWVKENKEVLNFIVQLKQYAWFEWGYLRLYEEQLKEYNERFTKDASEQTKNN